MNWEVGIDIDKRLPSRLVVSDCATLWTAAPLSMRFSRRESWSGLLCPPPRHLLYPGIEPGSPALQLSPQGSP